MSFTPKAWKDAPDTSTPLSAAALVDLETRLAAYADSGGAYMGPSKWFDITASPYNCVGDWNGTTGTDNTTGIQAAIDAATAAGGGIVWVPPGRYKVTARLTCTGRAVHIMGAGNRWSVPGVGDYPTATSEIVGVGSTVLGTDLLSFNPGGTQSFAYQQTINNLAVNKDGVSTGGANIRVTGGIGGVFRNVTVYKCFDGVIVNGLASGSAQGTWDQQFKNIHVHNAVRDGMVIAPGGGTYEVGETHIEQLITGTMGRHALHVAGGSYIQFRGLDLQNADSGSYGGIGNCLRVSGAANYLFFTDSGFEGGNTGLTHIYLTGTSDHIYFVNGYLGGYTTGYGPGLHVDGASDVGWHGGSMGCTSSTSIPVVKVSSGARLDFSGINFAPYAGAGAVACPILGTTAAIDALRFDRNRCQWGGAIDLGGFAHTNLSVQDNMGVGSIVYPSGMSAQGISGSKKVTGNQVAGTWS